jgi:hypothetical protein
MLSMILAALLPLSAHAKNSERFFCNIVEVQGANEKVRVEWFDGTEQKVNVTGELLHDISATIAVGEASTSRDGKKLQMTDVLVTVVDSTNSVRLVNQGSFAKSTGETIATLFTSGSYRRGNDERFEIHCAGPSPH